MIKLRTIVKIPKYEDKITHADKIMFIGSCFTENIGNKLLESLFKVDINPFGILYNPVSIRNSLEILINKKIFNLKDLNFYNGLWYSYFHHSKFSHNKQDVCLQKINEQLKISSNFLTQIKYLFITFGTAWVYNLAHSTQTVSNCHKIPDRNFNRKLLTTEIIISNYEQLIKLFNTINPNLKIIFTVSPVRHLRDGAIENQRSKAILLLAIKQIIEQYKNTYYFPAYEIVMDDLRDYRFYESDLTHINYTGINYIWEQFGETFFTKENRQKNYKAQKLFKSINHKPNKPKSEEYAIFRKKTLEKIKNFYLGIE